MVGRPPPGSFVARRVPAAGPAHQHVRPPRRRGQSLREGGGAGAVERGRALRVGPAAAASRAGHRLCRRAEGLPRARDAARAICIAPPAAVPARRVAARDGGYRLDLFRRRCTRPASMRSVAATTRPRWSHSSARWHRIRWQLSEAARWQTALRPSEAENCELPWRGSRRRWRRRRMSRKGAGSWPWHARPTGAPRKRLSTCSMAAFGRDPRASPASRLGHRGAPCPRLAGRWTPSGHCARRSKRSPRWPRRRMPSLSACTSSLQRRHEAAAAFEAAAARGPIVGGERLDELIGRLRLTEADFDEPAHRGLPPPNRRQPEPRRGAPDAGGHLFAAWSPTRRPRPSSPRPC